MTTKTELKSRIADLNDRINAMLAEVSQMKKTAQENGYPNGRADADAIWAKEQQIDSLIDELVDLKAELKSMKKSEKKAA